MVVTLSPWNSHCHSYHTWRCDSNHPPLGVVEGCVVRIAGQDLNTSALTEQSGTITWALNKGFLWRKYVPLLGRILIVPVFLSFAWRCGKSSLLAMFWRPSDYSSQSCPDYLDGYLARKWKGCSEQFWVNLRIPWMNKIPVMTAFIMVAELKNGSQLGVVYHHRSSVSWLWQGYVCFSLKTEGPF